MTSQDFCAAALVIMLEEWPDMTAEEIAELTIILVSE